MNVDQWLAISGRTWVKARKYQRHFYLLANVAVREGKIVQARYLKEIGDQALVAAEKFISQLQTQVDNKGQDDAKRARPALRPVPTGRRTEADPPGWQVSNPLAIPATQSRNRGSQAG